MRNYLRKGGTVLEILIIVAGLAMLAKAFTTGATTYKLVNLAESADGVISGTANYGFTAYVQFAAEKGVIYVFTQTGFIHGRNVGDRVPVLYNPQDPSDATLNMSGAIWFWPIVYTMVAILLLLIGSHLRYTRNL